jgi:hypothetical protein
MSPCDFATLTTDVAALDQLGRKATATNFLALSITFRFGAAGNRQSVTSSADGPVPSVLAAPSSPSGVFFIFHSLREAA